MTLAKNWLVRLPIGSPLPAAFACGVSPEGAAGRWLARISPINSSSRSSAITAVPESATLVLVGIGGVLACWAARRR